MTNPRLEAEINKQALQILAWLKHYDPSLYRDTMSTLTQLKKLSESPGASITANEIASSKKGAKAPTFRDDEKPLFEQMLRRLARCGKDASRVRGCREWATDELDDRKGNTRSQKPLGRDEEAPAESDKDAMERVVEFYAGYSPDRVVRYEGNNVPVDWVRKARRVHRRDPETGHQRRGWDGWDEAQRREEIEKRWNHGETQERVATALEVSTETLRRYWPGRQAQKSGKMAA